jgi:hypothetical protein
VISISIVIAILIYDNRLQVFSASFRCAVSQATANTATVTFYRACLASKIANGLDVGNEIIALKNLGVTI